VYYAESFEVFCSVLNEHDRRYAPPYRNIAINT
jgi:hypothetical protein